MHKVDGTDYSAALLADRTRAITELPLSDPHNMCIERAFIFVYHPYVLFGTVVLTSLVSLQRGLSCVIVVIATNSPKFGYSITHSVFFSSIVRFGKFNWSFMTFKVNLLNS